MISTPVTVVSGLAAAARRGILIKGGVCLEEARKLKAIALDKTGTTAEGKPKLVTWEAPNSADVDQVESVAAALAGESDPPISRAIARGLSAAQRMIVGFPALAGRGAQAKVEVEGVVHVLGHHRLIEARPVFASAGPPPRRQRARALKRHLTVRPF